MIVTVGVVFGDIGTSPLYVMRAIVAANHMPHISEEFIIGALSCIIWTLTLQTTIKYVIIALRADNKGEGGILALYSLVKKMKKKWLYLVAILGAATLVSDGVITPSMTIVSAIEGLKNYNPNTQVVPITIFILIALFVIQQFGTQSIGKFYGPIMTLWFIMLGVLGLIEFLPHLYVIKAFNPYYAIHLMMDVSSNAGSVTEGKHMILLIMGAVFLCTTGAEALYSDLGHCGIKNIRISWIFAKVCLILNYLGQGAWILANPEQAQSGGNPFFMMMPETFLIIGVIMATLAAIIASQALITGSYTIFSEAMSLNFWPRQRVEYPTHEKGQMYIPAINWGLLVSCIFVVLHFKESAKMEAAYGLAITITMLMTTILLVFYLKLKKVHALLIVLFGAVYLIIEGGFFYANVLKFAEGGWITMFLAGLIAVCMYVWFNGRKLKNKYVQYVDLKPCLPIIKDMKVDTSLSKYATNLVYISRSNSPNEIEAKIIFSIINKNPKRADYYWFLKVENDLNPYTFEYDVMELIPDTLYQVKFRLGFKVEPLINIYFAQVLEDLKVSGKINLISKYPSLRKHDIPADFKFILIDRVFNQEYLLSIKERFILRFYNMVKYMGISDTSALGLDSYNVEVEQVPMLTDVIYKNRIKRVRIY
ncbi:potassium transporter Kup [Apibacter muscae]|uniref:Probable potassium transport system protein Kup n=1 Tax=Apibacter muscae TaxID=2509004 RepID=A0A563DG66_9FLAO|nr:KUP/HAK/KT family potassium transporter [Apibacter muscae]TWP24504.1 potassium transporter Kup [Apibacter muscae]TWP28814.1 potassium transporter Kup [Apibacter muscae]TWP30220.1 potassium transporter Kup [Apibacter muscae]